MNRVKGKVENSKRDCTESEIHKLLLDKMPDLSYGNHMKRRGTRDVGCICAHHFALCLVLKLSSSIFSCCRTFDSWEETEKEVGGVNARVPSLSKVAEARQQLIGKIASWVNRSFPLSSFPPFAFLKSGNFVFNSKASGCILVWFGKKRSCGQVSRCMCSPAMENIVG